MRSWTNTKMRRVMWAGALAVTVGLPTLACSGSSDSEDAVEEVVEEDDSFDPEEAIVGTWMIQPEKAQLRELKILDFAINKPKTGVEQLKKRLKPPPTEAEIITFKELRKADPSSPEVEFAKMYLEMLKSARLEISSSKWTLDMAGEKDSWGYTIESKTDDALKVKLESGEVNELSFANEDLIDVEIKQQGESLRLRFKREN